MEDGMFVAQILAGLRQEREQIAEAILGLEELTRNRGRRLSRHPARMTKITAKRCCRPPGNGNKATPK